jgi:CBS domain-containing protein
MVVGMRVEDAMTSDVLTASPELPVKDAAAILARHGISGLPVVADGAVVGVLSEADVVARTAGSRESRSLLGLLFAGRTGEPDVDAVRTEEAMSSPAITISPGQPVAAAARLMVDRRVNRLPVVDGTQLVGILTRADIVHAFVRPDEELEREIREDVAGRALWIDPAQLEIEVDHGAVVLGGEVERRVDAELLERLTAAVPGVVSVRSDLRWQLEDAKLEASDPRVPRPPPPH